MVKDKVYLLTKTADNKFNGIHPNGIDVGYCQAGIFVDPPTVGKRFLIRGMGINNYLITSTVTEIINKTTFKTENSTYKLERLRNGRGVQKV